MDNRETPITPGEIAPAFSLPAHDGSTVSLDDLLQMPRTILYFMREFNCAQCQRNIKDLLRVYKRYGLADQFSLVVIGGGKVARAKAMVESLHLDVAVLADAERDVYHAYGLHRAMSLIQRHATIIVDSERVVRYVRFAVIPGGAFDEADFTAALETMLAEETPTTG